MTSHMILESGDCLSQWEERMIAHTSLEHILFADCVREDGRNSLWYDITGKQSMDTLLDTGGLQYELLCNLLAGIYQAVEQLEGILLQAEGLLLLPECIFVDYRTEALYFCYCPGNGEELPRAFEELMQYLLTKADHGDERVVELVYSVYDRATKGSGSLLELKELLRMPYEKEVQEEEDVQVEETENIRSEETEDIQSKETEKNSVVRKEARDNQFIETTLLQHIIKKFTDFWKACIGKRNPQKKSRRVAPEEKFVFEPEEEEILISRPTVLLSELTKRPEGVLRYEGMGACKDLVIEGDSYVIGSAPDCGGYISSTTVSRRHAQITQKEGIYFIEDLNSSNGTYVGGELLNYKTKVSLQRNEIVIFADEKFRFI